MSATVVSGWRLRNLDTIWAAVRLPPPRSKKSSSPERGVAPMTSPHSSATHAPVPVSSSCARVSSAPSGSGHGRASRSTFPEVLVGSDPTVANRGTSAAGCDSRNRARAVGASKVSSTWT